MLNLLQYTRQPHPHNHLAQNVNSFEVENYDLINVLYRRDIKTIFIESNNLRAEKGFWRIEHMESPRFCLLGWWFWDIFCSAPHWALPNWAPVANSVDQLNNVFELDFPPSLSAHPFLPLLFLGITSQIIIYCTKALISGMLYRKKNKNRLRKQDSIFFF